MHLHFPDQGGEIVVHLRNLQFSKIDVGRIEWKSDSEAEFGIHEEGNLVLGLLHSPLLQLVLDLPDKGGTNSLLKLIRRRVQIEYLDDLRHPQLVTHVTDARHVLLRLPGLEQLRGLDDGQEGVNDLAPRVLQVLIPGPLLQLCYVVPRRKNECN